VQLHIELVLELLSTEDESAKYCFDERSFPINGLRYCRGFSSLSTTQKSLINHLQQSH
jgi:hypothetical protein